jgi:hypothetical protein
VPSGGDYGSLRGILDAKRRTPDGAALSLEIKLLLARILRPEFQSKSGAKFGLKILADFQEEVRCREYFAEGMLRGLRGASPGTLRDRVQVLC